MRIVVLTMGTAMILFFVVVLVRVALFTSKQPSVEPAQPIRLDANQASERLAGALRIQTVSYQDQSQINHQTFLAFHDYLVKVT